MQLSQIFIGLIVGGVLLAVAWGLESKILRLGAVLVAAAFVISGLGISRNIGLVILVVVAIAWLSISLYLKHKPREIAFGKDFMQDLKARVEVREALMSKEVTAIIPVPPAVPTASKIVDLIELTEEEKIANLEREAALAEREADALLRKRVAGQRLEKAFHEDVIEAERRKKALEKTVNPPSPPPTPSPTEIRKKLAELEAEKNKTIQEYLAAGHDRDSTTVVLAEVTYEKEVKALQKLLVK